MKKQELIKRVAEKTGSTVKDASLHTEAVIESLKEGIKEDGKVTLQGFGSFNVKERKERKGVNPQTQESIIIPAKKVCSFKPAEALKELVND